MKAARPMIAHLAATLPDPAHELTVVFYDCEEVEAARNGWAASSAPCRGCAPICHPAEPTDGAAGGRLPGHAARGVSTEATGRTPRGPGWAATPSTPPRGVAPAERLPGREVDIDAACTGGAAGGAHRRRGGRERRAGRLPRSPSTSGSPRTAHAAAAEHVEKVFAGLSCGSPTPPPARCPGWPLPPPSGSWPPPARARCQVRLDGRVPVRRAGHPGDQLRSRRPEPGAHPREPRGHRRRSPGAPSAARLPAAGVAAIPPTGRRAPNACTQPRSIVAVVSVPPNPPEPGRPTRNTRPSGCAARWCCAARAVRNQRPPTSACSTRAARPIGCTRPVAVLRIQAEFVEGFGMLAELPRAVTVFGSARTNRTIRVPAGRQLGASLAKAGFAVMTGGGPGTMRRQTGAVRTPAAVRGAGHRAAVRTGPEPVGGPRHQLPLLLRPQDHVRQVLPGFRLSARRFGTLDELFEALTLVQTKKVTKFPWCCSARSTGAGCTTG